MTVRTRRRQSGTAHWLLFIVAIVAITLATAYIGIYRATGVDVITFFSSVREFNEAQATAQVLGTTVPALVPSNTGSKPDNRVVPTAGPQPTVLPTAELVQVQAAPEPVQNTGGKIEEVAPVQPAPTAEPNTGGKAEPEPLVIQVQPQDNTGGKIEERHGGKAQP